MKKICESNLITYDNPKIIEYAFCYFLLERVNPVAEKSSFSWLCSRQYKKLLVVNENHFDTRSSHNLRGYLHFYEG